MKTLGSRIVGLRQELGITQISLAKSVGVTKSMLSKYENDINVPKADVMGAIATCLDTSADFLLGKTENPAPAEKKDTWMHLRDDEYELLQGIRALNAENKTRIKERIECLAEIQKNNEVK